MNTTLRTAMLATAVTAMLPAGAALASGSHGDEHRKGKHKQSKCHKGKGYEVQGLLAEGSSLTQVSGADTRRRGDDRFSGKLVVEVKQGNKRGRRDKGLSSYVLDSVRINGAGSGESALPELGSRVLLVGKQTPAWCRPAEPDPTTPTTPDPDYPTDPEPAATAMSYGDDDGDRREHPKGMHPKHEDSGSDDYPGGDDYPGDHHEGEDCPEPTSPGDEPSDYPTDYPSDYPTGDEATAVTDVTIRLVRFGAPR